MPHDAMPDAVALVGWLKNAGAFNGRNADQAGAIDYDSAISAAVDRWEGDTGISPWVATQQALRFDVPRYQGGPASDRLYLGTGVLSVATIRVQKTATNAGVLLVEGTDFWLGPDSAPIQKKPYTHVQFLYPAVAFATLGRWLPKTIEIDGVFGFAQDVADDVWEAVLNAAVASVLPSIQKLTTPAVVSKEEGDVKTVYVTSNGRGSFSDLIEACEARYKAVLKRPSYQMKVMR